MDSKLNLAYPRQVILVTSRAQHHTRFDSKKLLKDNIVTLSWHTPVSSDPLLYAISLSSSRYSYELIKESGVFAINFMPYDLKKQSLFCGRNSGETIDKFKETGLTKEECEKIDCPRIKESLGIYECEVIDEFDTGDHKLIIGKVLNTVRKHDDNRSFQVSGELFTTTI